MVLLHTRLKQRVGYFAIGYISATQPRTDKHPMEVKKWLYEGVFKS